MKKLFVSMPMAGMTDEEIKDKLLVHKMNLERLMSTKFELINTCITEIPEDMPNVSVWYIGKSLVLMGQADLVYFVEGWADARGCVIEHEVAKRYNIKCVYEYAEIRKHQWATVNKLGDAMSVLRTVKDKLLLQDRQIEAAVVEKKINELNDSLRVILCDLAREMEE